MKRSKKKNKLIPILVILLLGVTLGYAYLNTELNINGTTNVSSANWNIYWDNIVFGDNNVTDVTTPATIQTGETEVLFNVNFSEPGDTYEFTVDAVNDGTIDGMISVVSNGVYAINGTTPKDLPDYLEYTVTYEDGTKIAQNHILEIDNVETYKVRVHYKEDISSSQLPSTTDNFVFKFSVTYVQADDQAIVRPIKDYVYTFNVNNLTYIGNTIPNNVITYQDYQDVLDNYSFDFFLKHGVLNNQITESYIGFVYNNNVYYLRGAGATYNSETRQYNNDSPYYESNKATLINAYGSNNCSDEDSEGITCSVDLDGYYEASTAYATRNGAISVYNTYAYDCRIFPNGSSKCRDW